MSTKKADFVKSIHGMNENDLKARLEEDKLRLKNSNSLTQFHL